MKKIVRYSDVFQHFFLGKERTEYFSFYFNQPQTNYAQKIGNTRNACIKTFSSIQTFKTSIWIT